MKKILLQDIVIKAGTVFNPSPIRKEFIGEGYYEHVLGLTDDTSGDLCYFIDPGDPKMVEWFGEEGDEFKAEPNNIVMMDNEPTFLRVPPERVLEAAKGHLKDVLVLGIDKDNLFYFCSSTSDKKESLWVVDNFKNQLLNGFKDMNVVGDEIDTSGAELADEAPIEEEVKFATITNFATPGKKGEGDE